MLEGAGFLCGQAGGELGQPGCPFIPGNLMLEKRSRQVTCVSERAQESPATQGPGRHALCPCTRGCVGHGCHPSERDRVGGTLKAPSARGAPTGGAVSQCTCLPPTCPVPLFTELLLPAGHSGPSAEWQAGGPGRVFHSEVTLSPERWQETLPSQGDTRPRKGQRSGDAGPRGR